MATPSRGIGKGGTRDGAGRPFGSIHHKARDLIAKVERAGKQLPLDFLLELMHDETAERRDRAAAACACLPYCHARIYALKVLPTDPEHMDDVVLATQLTRLERQAAKQPEDPQEVVDTQFDRLLEDLPRLPLHRQEAFLRKMLKAVEDGMQRLDEAPDPPGTVVPRVRRQAPAAAPQPVIGPLRRPGAPAPAAVPETNPEPSEDRWHYDPATKTLQPGPLPR